MLLLIIGLHFVLGSIWLINNDYSFFGVASFVAGMAATHHGWKQLSAKKRSAGDKTDEHS
ncbi:MAG TPA: hypothetical protein VJ969_05390 [Desulfopila sp.]|nr:hypothetical protein [Desulfopila sp.]